MKEIFEKSLLLWFDFEYFGSFKSGDVQVAIRIDSQAIGKIAWILTIYAEISNEAFISCNEKKTKENSRKCLKNNRKMMKLTDITGGWIPIKFFQGELARIDVEKFLFFFIPCHTV